MKSSKEKATDVTPDNFAFVSLGNGGDVDFGEVIVGLRQTPKVVSPKFFYDARGSELFNAICTTEAYYPTRTERGIYESQADAIAAEIGPGTTVIEFGPGDMSKIRLLLDQLRPQTYVGVDVSAAQLEDAGPPLAADYPWLHVLAVCGDFGPSRMLEKYLDGQSRRVAFFPGSTIGNFEPDAARQFLQGLGKMLGSSGCAIVGVDLQKPVEVLEAAYNDPQGYTRAFNLNLLTRLNRELGADFDERRFRHKAYYNEKLGRVEMHLVSVVEQQVRVGEHTFSFQPGETIHTENSWKYTQQAFGELAARAGFAVQKFFTDERNWFGVFILSVQ